MAKEKCSGKVDKSTPNEINCIVKNAKFLIKEVKSQVKWQNIQMAFL